MFIKSDMTPPTSQITIVLVRKVKSSVRLTTSKESRIWSKVDRFEKLAIVSMSQPLVSGEAIRLRMKWKANSSHPLYMWDVTFERLSLKIRPLFIREKTSNEGNRAAKSAFVYEQFWVEWFDCVPIGVLGLDLEEGNTTHNIYDWTTIDIYCRKISNCTKFLLLKLTLSLEFNKLNFQKSEEQRNEHSLFSE